MNNIRVTYNYTDRDYENFNTEDLTFFEHTNVIFNDGKLFFNDEFFCREVVESEPEMTPKELYNYWRLMYE